MSMVERTCQNKTCGTKFTARTADVKRGWAKFCSKRCKAVEQERRTGQYRALLAGDDGTTRDNEQAMADAEAGWDGHKGVF